MRSASIPLEQPATLITPTSSDWPPALSDLKKPPLWLYCAGELSDLSDAVAIVGTRYADDDALKFATDLAADLAETGRVVVSGGARGIDAAAHRGALSAGGRTVAVLATGVGHAYPPEHAELFGQIARAGCLLSEEPEGVAPRPGLFLKRNRLIAALAASVVVVQAPMKSGALSTARAAAELKRRLFTVPSTPWEARGSGCLWLLRQGGLICTSAADVLSVRPSRVARPAGLPRERAKNANDSNNLDAQCRAILEALGRRALHPDDLCQRVGLPIADLHAKLLQLVLLGELEPRADGTYAKP